MSKQIKHIKVGRYICGRYNVNRFIQDSSPLSLPPDPQPPQLTTSLMFLGGRT